MVFAKALLLANLATCLLASPAPTALQERQVNCNAVTGVLAVLKPLGGIATHFCSSYLRVPGTTTVTTTSNPPAVTNTISTTTTYTLAQCPNQVKRAPMGQRDIAAREHHHLGTHKRTPELEKRINIPALSRFAAAQLSSACGCLSIKPKVTATSTFVAQPGIVDTTRTLSQCTTPPGPVCPSSPPSQTVFCSPLADSCVSTAECQLVADVNACDAAYAGGLYVTYEYDNGVCLLYPNCCQRS